MSYILKWQFEISYVIKEVKYMAFQIKSDRKDSETKSIRFPKKLIERIEAAIQEQDVTFTGFVTQACEYALDNMIENDKNDKNKED